MLKVGTEVRGYRIEGVLGHGGMGIVYEARQISLDRLVALKVLAPELSMDVSFRERFRREGQIQAAIDHPHIVTVHEAGEIDEGLFIAMRIVRGPTLKDMIIGRELEAARTLRILTPIADALDAAHGGGLIHRDVKPQNILVGARDHPFLADFGLTKGANESGLTRTGQFVGTIDYISPEQIRGEPAQPASDVYALAAVLYECLTGVVPYAKPSDAAVLFAHMSDPRPLVTEKRPDLPPALNDVIVRGMDLNPANRHSSGTDLIEDAERAFGRRIRAALTPPGPIELPEEVGIREPEGKVPTRETRIRQAAELADATAAGATRPRVPVEVPPPVDEPSPAETAERAAPEDTTLRPVAETAERAAPDETTLRPVADDAPAASDSEVAAVVSDPVVSAPPTAETEVAATPVAAAVDAFADAPATTPDRAGTGPTLPHDAAARPATVPPARQRSAVPLAPLVAIAAVVAIVVGFLVGDSGSGGSTEPAALSGAAASADLGVNFPATWRRAATPRTISGLSFTRPVGLQRTGSTDTGVVAGLVDGAGPTLLPAAFIATLPSAPKAAGDPVKLGSFAAYRYDGLRPKGFTGQVTVFTIPTSQGVAAIACYRPVGADGEECDRIAGSLRLERGTAYALGPEKAYGAALRADIAALDARRTSLRARLAAAKTPAGQASVATDLAAAYRTAGSGLAGLTVGPHTEAANARVVAALRATASAYQRLAAGARDQRAAAYAAARTSVSTNEDAVQRQLTALTALGYQLA